MTDEDLIVIRKEIVLELACQANSNIDKYDAVHELVDNLPQDFIDEFNRCDGLTIDQMREEQLDLTGNSYTYF